MSIARACWGRLLLSGIVGTGVRTPLEALQAATLNPAKAFHLTDSLGTGAPGKLVDLVLLDRAWPMSKPTPLHAFAE